MGRSTTTGSTQYCPWCHRSTKATAAAEEIAGPAQRVAAAARPTLSNIFHQLALRGGGEFKRHLRLLARASHWPALGRVHQPFEFLSYLVLQVEPGIGGAGPQTSPCDGVLDLLHHTADTPVLTRGGKSILQLRDQVRAADHVARRRSRHHA